MFRFIIFVFLVLILHTAPAISEPFSKPVLIKILGLNDFHGQISTGRRVNNRPVGGAVVMAAYLKNAEKGLEANTVIALMGDQVGASTPASGLLQDEPTILFFNTLANTYCSPKTRMDTKCNIVATVGNHEFDKGKKALFDKIYGTEKPPTDSWYPLPHYPGASFPYISANIVDAKTGKNIFPPYVIKNINGIKIGFIGAILKDAPDAIVPSEIEGIKFLNEAEAINHYIPEMKAKGANIIIVIIHQGGQQTFYEGNTKDNIKSEGKILDVVKQLDDVDVVMSGHTHLFLNTFLTNHNGKKILVTEANNYSSAFAEVTLTVDKNSHSILHKTARIITTYADQWPGTLPDRNASHIVKLAEDKVAPIVQAQVGILQNDLLKKGNDAGESNLGNLITDSLQRTMKTDIAFLNPGGMRADIYAGKVTWGNLYAVQPFGNVIVKMSLTGEEIYQLLEQQWRTTNTIILQVSGLSYTYDASKPIGNRVIQIYHDGQPLQKNKTYTVATNYFLMSGGDGFTMMRHGKILAKGMTDLEVFVKYVKQMPQPFSMKIEGRIKKINSF